jgi:hypothetical protein
MIRATTAASMSNPAPAAIPMPADVRELNPSPPVAASGSLVGCTVCTVWVCMTISSMVVSCEAAAVVVVVVKASRVAGVGYFPEVATDGAGAGVTVSRG